MPLAYIIHNRRHDHMGNHMQPSCVYCLYPQDCKFCVAKNHACPQPARCLVLSKYLLSKWRSSSITSLRLATAPTRSRLPETTEPSPARLEQGPGLSPLSLGVQNVSGSTSQDQTFGFQPCHILTGWGHATDLPVLPPPFLSAMSGDPVAGQDTDLPEVLCRECPPRE